MFFKILLTQCYKLGLFLIELNAHKKYEGEIKKKDFISSLKFRILKLNKFTSISEKEY